MIVSRYCKGDPLDLPPFTFFAILNRASRVYRMLSGLVDKDEANAVALSRQLPEDW